MDTTNITRDQAIETLLVDHFKGDEQALVNHLYRRSKRGSNSAYTTFTPYYIANNLLYQIDNMSDYDEVTDEQCQEAEDFIMSRPEAASDYYISHIENNDTFHEIENEAARDALREIMEMLESEKKPRTVTFIDEIGQAMVDADKEKPVLGHLIN